MAGRWRKTGLRVMATIAASMLASGVLFSGALAAEPAMRTETASAEFDRLFALAQVELDQDKVDAITDWSFNDQKPFPCVCFETGEKWHYVWTRDLSYAADLALARLDPERTKTSLRFKLSEVRNPARPQGLYVAQDTGSGGSWPISTDRVVWFLAARHLLDDPRFADETWRALNDTLAQDRQYVFDASMGLYRGETSFLDWREQNYPAWTAKDTTFIAQSFALSTNVLHYEALRLAQRMAGERKDPRASQYGREADALREAIDRRFWREDRGLYMSWIGPAFTPMPIESYDLLGTSLAILAGVAPQDRAHKALANYPVVEHGSPVIWPQQPNTAIYHNRAMWPFVSAYALRAARKTANAERIEHEIRSLMRGTARAGSNMENYELTTQDVHVEDGALSGPVVNSKRQLWSVAGYIDMVQRGVFGLEEEGRVAPLLPVALAKELFGDRKTIALKMPGKTIVLRRPKQWVGPLLGAADVDVEGETVTIGLGAGEAPATTLVSNGAAFAPAQPPMPDAFEHEDDWGIDLPEHTRLYVDGVLRTREDASRTVSLPKSDVVQCLTLTAVANGIESLPSPTQCVQNVLFVGAQGLEKTPYTAPRDGRYRLTLLYRNANGPVNTGITAAVKTLVADCGGTPQRGTVVMPHNEAATESTAFTFEAKRGDRCTFRFEDGFNMSDLAHFANYTGGKGGASGPLNTADVTTFTIVPAR